jgi:hypothetical protein
MIDEALAFIRQCIRQRSIIWSYHVNMRMEQRSITRNAILAAEPSFEIIENYPDDKYLPSCLVYACYGTGIFHLHIAIDKEGGNIRIITAYNPSTDKWNSDFKTRRAL